MRSARAVRDDRLLTEPNNVLEVVCLGCIGTTLHGLRVKNERASGIIRRATEAELLWLTAFLTITGSNVALGRVEIDQVTRSEVHILHVGALLVTHVRW